MSKEEMYKNVRFPWLGDKIMNFLSLDYQDPLSIPSVGSWIFCIITSAKGNFCGIYQWQEKNNPQNITAYTYINIGSNNGPVRYVQYEHYQDEQIMIVVDEKQAHLITE